MFSMGLFLLLWETIGEKVPRTVVILAALALIGIPVASRITGALNNKD